MDHQAKDQAVPDHESKDTATKYALEMRGIVKQFGKNIAVDGVDFNVRPGTVHALLGENGAGKSTLMNCLFGLQSLDEGEVFINGERVTISSPRDAMNSGVGMVHQHFKLVPGLTVAENVFLGKEKTSKGFLDTHSAEKEVERLSEEYGLQANPRDIVRSLSVGGQQRVEIIRALSEDVSVLVLDEPTAVLTPAEAEKFFGVVRGFASLGLAIVLISHHLEEVLSVADEVTVLRRGKLVATHAIEEVTAPILAELIVGQDRGPASTVPLGTPGEPVMLVDDVNVFNRFGNLVVDNATFVVRAGEIVALLGIAGNGQTELVEAVTGIRKMASGSVSLGDVRIDGDASSPVRDLREGGLAHIPEDRIGRGMAGLWSVENNIAVGFLDSPDLGQRGLDSKRKKQFVEKLLESFDVRVANANQLARRLSGGNAQKMVLSRELSTHPRVVVCAEPTRGLDIAATEFVRNELVRQRDEGVGILLVSSDIGEVLQIADRVLVIYGGKIIAEFPGRPDENEVGRAMLGDVA